MKHLYTLLINIALASFLALVIPHATGGETTPQPPDLLDSKQVALDVPSGDLLEVAAAIGEQTGIPVCLEMQFPSKKEARRIKVPIAAGRVTARSALNTLVSGTERLVWRQQKALVAIDIMPANVENDPAWTLNLRCPEFEAENVSAGEAIALLSDRVFPNGDRAIRPFAAGSFMSRPGEDLMQHPLVKFHARRISLTVKEGTVREALNQIAAAIGNAWWVYSEDGEYQIVAFHPVTPNVYPATPPPSAPPP